MKNKIEYRVQCKKGKESWRDSRNVQDAYASVREAKENITRYGSVLCVYRIVKTVQVGPSIKP